MMQLKGSIEIHRIDSRTQETKEIIKQNNVIPNATLISLLNWNSSYNFFGSLYISLSTSTATPNVNTNSFPGVFATGYVPSGVTSPDWYEGVTPPFGQVRNRFDIPPGGIARTFNSVGLTNQNSNNNQSNVTAVAYAYVKLDIACTQGIFDIIDIYYRIQFQNNSRGFLDSNRATKDFGRWLFGKSTSNTGYRISYLYTHFSKLSFNAISNFKGLYASSGIQDAYYSSGVFNWTSGSSVSSHYKFKYIMSADRTKFIGRVFSCMMQGISDIEECAYNEYNFNYDKEPFQTGFWHSTGSTTPFFDANFAGSSNGKVTLSGTWAGGFPMLFRINIGETGSVTLSSAASGGTTTLNVVAITKQINSGTLIVFTNGVQATLTTTAAINSTTLTVSAISGSIPSATVGNYSQGGGNAGIATYNWSVRRHLGFTGSNYTDQTFTGSPFRNPNVIPATGMHGWNDTLCNDILRFSDTKIVQYDQSGVTLLDLMTGDFINWDNTTTPAIGAGSSSDIRQCSVDTTNGIIYVADRVTGLWVITVSGTTSTVSNPVSSPCYGVDVGRNNVAYAIFNGFFKNSSNWSVNIAITFTGLTDNNWSRTKFIKCDPGQTDDQIAIVADNGSGTNRVIWYKSTGNTMTLGYSGTDVKSWAASLDVSDTGGFWAILSKKLTFNSTTTTTIANVPFLSITHSVFGTDNFYKISFYGQYLITSSSIVNSSNTSIATYTSISSMAFVTHLVGGIIIGTKLMRQLFTDNTTCWENYGWDGTQWVLNGTGTRVSSTSPQLLGYGISAAFTDGTNQPNFTATDYFTEGVCYGFWKDNASDINYVSQWYTKPVEFNYPIPSGVTIPANAQYTLTATQDANYTRIETDSITSLASFYIAGNPVTTVYVNGETPGVNEISVNGTSGMVTFNAADIGKTFSGTYAWIRFA